MPVARGGQLLKSQNHYIKIKKTAIGDPLQLLSD
jgi:hypothetical protein